MVMAAALLVPAGQWDNTEVGPLQPYQHLQTQVHPEKSDIKD